MDDIAPDIQFFREMVEPTVDEFMADKSNLRRGLRRLLPALRPIPRRIALRW